MLRQVSPSAALTGESNIQLTLLVPSGPGGVLQWGPFGRGLRPRGHGLDGPRLFSRQSLQADLPLHKHLLDILQALQCFQDTGLQAESSLSLLVLIVFVNTQSSC